jgi:hypothetical protein
MLCFGCGLSARNGQMMISCDFCPLHWHLDCLEAPLCIPPAITDKWMCPCHAAHDLPHLRSASDPGVYYLTNGQSIRVSFPFTLYDEGKTSYVENLPHNFAQKVRQCGAHQDVKPEVANSLCILHIVASGQYSNQMQK